MTEQPWFSRRRRGLGYKLTPASWQGWILTVVFVAVALGITSLAARGKFLLWGTLLAVVLFLYLLAAWRTSSPNTDDD